MARSIARWSLLLVVLGSGSPLIPAGRLDAPEIREASGIVKSRRHPGIFWVHNDSGNPPTLFAVRADGSLVRSYKVGAPNVDWEDIAVDDAGHLFLGDIGNNDGRLPLRAVYRIDEPDPARPAAEPLKVNLAAYYTFPKGRRFDAESLFIQASHAYLVTKRHDGQPADLYRIALDPPASILRPALPERVGDLPGCTEPATGADLSADGRRLAVVTNSAARVYELGPKGKWQLRATMPFHARDVEAICWDGLDLVLAGEDRSIYRIAEKTWKAAR